MDYFEVQPQPPTVKAMDGRPGGDHELDLAELLLRNKNSL
jgi:hypothetical protein